jgi:hypothetical protein
MMVSHHDHHRHSAYCLAHVDAAGFSQSQQRRLAALVLAQRGGLRKVEASLTQEEFAWQVLCLRLAIIACHARAVVDPDALALRRSGRGRDAAAAFAVDADSPAHAAPAQRGDGGVGARRAAAAGAECLSGLRAASRQRESGDCTACSTTCAPLSRSRLFSHHTAAFFTAHGWSVPVSQAPGDQPERGLVTDDEHGLGRVGPARGLQDRVDVRVGLQRLERLVGPPERLRRLLGAQRRAHEDARSNARGAG